MTPVRKQIDDLYSQGKTREEIADTLGIPLSRVKNRIRFNARKAATEIGKICYKELVKAVANTPEMTVRTFLIKMRNG